MISELRIRNLVLVETADVPFAPGLNVLTGETGSGKSALMAGIALIAGERADLSLIRHGAEKAVVEALFEIAPTPELLHLLDESGIEASAEEPLVIRREIAANGKGRTFINQQPVHVSFLKTLKPFLLEQVNQHANHQLFSVEAHRKIVDLFGDLTEEVRAFGQSWHEENLLRNELDELTRREAERMRDIARYRDELEEIQEAEIQEGEEEELFSAYTRLTHTEELLERVGKIEGELTPMLPVLKGHLGILEKLSELDPLFKEMAAFYQSAVLELQESGRSLERYLASIETNPEQLEQVSERLTLLNKLMRKYGPTVADILHHADHLKKQLEILENSDQRIESIKKNIESLSQKNNSLAKELTAKRTKAASLLAAALSNELKQLNMPDAQVEAKRSPAPRCQYGDDRVELFIRPNKGEKMVSVKDCASGGEISRLLLSIQTLLAGKEATPTLIFDEVDANIGGETATVVGEKLRSISKQHQLLIITHFPQVAKQADHHIRIAKQEISGRTVTTIEAVKGKKRDAELSRMLG